MLDLFGGRRTPHGALAPTGRRGDGLRVRPRLLVGLVLCLAVFFFTLVRSAPTPRTEVVVVKAAVAAGATIRADDLGTVAVDLDGDTLDTLFPAAERARLVGTVARGPLAPHQLLARSQIVATGAASLRPDMVAIAIAVKPETAVGGRLRVGDHVAILSTVNKGKPDARTTVLLADAVIYAVERDARGVVSSSSGSSRPAEDDRAPLTALTLEVSVDDAVTIAGAKASGELDVALLPARP